MLIEGGAAFCENLCVLCFVDGLVWHCLLVPMRLSISAGMLSFSPSCAVSVLMYTIRFSCSFWQLAHSSYGPQCEARSEYACLPLHCALPH